MSKTPLTDTEVKRLLAPIGRHGGDRNDDARFIYMDPQTRFAAMAEFAGKLEQKLARAAKERCK